MTRWRWLVAATLLVGACSSGGDGDARAPTTTTPEASATEATPPETTASTDGTAAAGTDEVGAGGTDGENVDGPPPIERVQLPGLASVEDISIDPDPEVRTGRLDNGLVYHVRANDNPGGKADLRLAIRGGSVDEVGLDGGVAHFVEHMLFNGTERFPENELIDTLRGFGAAFGADINAYTSFDETVYTLTVPSDDESISTGLDVLEQWLSHATFADDQVVAERGVVLDEWRVRTQTPQGRLFPVVEQMFLADTAYAGRSPIGSSESISTTERETLVSYYERWYRPDNAAIIVVGDIDVDDMVGRIERLFGPTPADGPTPAGPAVDFDLDLEPDAAIHLDPDQQTVDVEVTLPLPAIDGEGTLPLRASLVDAMISDALVRRLRDDVASGVATFDDIARGSNSFVDGLDAPALYAFTDADRSSDTVQALLDEYLRAARFGFTGTETDLARADLRSFYEARFEGRDSTQDTVYASALVEAFLRDAPYPSIDDEFELVTALIDVIDADELTSRFRARWTNSAPHVIIAAPSDAGADLPSVDDVLAMVADLEARDVDERGANRDLPDALMNRPEPQVPLVIESVIDSGDRLFDPVRRVYPNGVTVILNSNEIVEGQVFFQAASPGGSSLVADADVVDALYAAEIVTSGGLGDFNQAELARILAGTDTQISAWIDPYVDHLAGSAATDDVEELFQQIHLYMTEPRFDPVALSQVERRLGPLVDDPGSDARAAGDDALRDLRYPGELRYATLPEPDEFATLDLDGVERVWRSRYGDASDWVIVLSGDIDVDAVGELADAYLGTLPGTGTVESWVDVEDPPPPDVRRADVAAGTGDTASVTLLFTSPIRDINARVRVTSDVATQVLQARLTDVIRERLGESYSPFAVSFVTTDPDPVVETYISVSGSPDRIDAIGDLVVAEIADLSSDGAAEREISNAFATVAESLNFVNNGSFVSELLDSEIHPARDIRDYREEFAELTSLGPGDVTGYVRAHMPIDRYIQVTVRPR